MADIIKNFVSLLNIKELPTAWFCLVWIGLVFLLLQTCWDFWVETVSFSNVLGFFVTPKLKNTQMYFYSALQKNFNKRKHDQKKKEKKMMK